MEFWQQCGLVAPRGGTAKSMVGPTKQEAARRLWPGGHSTQTTHAITNYLIYYSNLYKHVGAVVA